jgi:threonine dehydratase
MSSAVVDLDRIREAQARIGPHVEQTPVRRAEATDIWLKCENRQKTGAFKVRGALNKVLSLGADEMARGVVAASAGNHGQGVALACRLRGAGATIVVPKAAVALKVERIRSFGAEVVFADGDYGAAEARGLELAKERGAVWISPYNDPEVIAGQGTIGLELIEQLDLAGGGDGWEVYVPVSGGGLISGIGIALKATASRVRVVGVQPAAAPYMHTFFYGGDIGNVVETPTIADGLAGAVEGGSITFELVHRAADDIVLVSEQEIWKAIRWADLVAGEVIEPAAAAALAACLRAGGSRNRIAVLSGGNIDPAVLESARGGGEWRVDGR